MTETKQREMFLRDLLASARNPRVKSDARWQLRRLSRNRRP